VLKREIIVIKCGGSVVSNPSGVCADVAALAAARQPVVLVHGGGTEIDRLAARLQMSTRHLFSPDGLSARFTDQATIEVVSMALAGVVQPGLITAMLEAGVPAVGLTGVHADLLTARRRGPQRTIADGRLMVTRGDLSGTITGVNIKLLKCIIEAGFVPVVSPPARTDAGFMVNVNADRVAAAVASALRASALVLLTGARGVLADPADPESMMPVCEIPRHGAPPKRDGGMGVKLIAARDALVAGVPTVLVADGRQLNPVRQALAGAATHVTLAASDPDSTNSLCPDQRRLGTHNCQRRRNDAA
jgi:acetylglutamate/LysW-gamma-L-alpha-aminoadipate kinase